MAQVQPVQTGTSEDTKTIVTVLLLVFLFPVGFLLMWFWTKWKLWVKLLISLPIFGVISVIALMAVNPNAAKKQAECYVECVKSNSQSYCTNKCQKSSYTSDTVSDKQRDADLDVLDKALGKYYDDNQVYPANLSLLTPKYLKSIPADPKTGKQYRYKTLNKGQDFSIEADMSDGTTSTLETTE